MLKYFSRAKRTDDPAKMSFRNRSEIKTSFDFVQKGINYKIIQISK